jgi:hypothetical protein
MRSRQNKRIRKGRESYLQRDSLALWDLAYNEAKSICKLVFMEARPLPKALKHTCHLLSFSNISMPKHAPIASKTIVSVSNVRMEYTLMIR